MNLWSKIENAINLFLSKLGEFAIKLIPLPIRLFFSKTSHFFLQLPVKLITLGQKITNKLVSSFQAADIRSGLMEAYKNTMVQAKLRKPTGMGKFKTFLLTPFWIVGQWLNGLTAGQSLLLLTFTSASFLSVIGIGFSGQKLITSSTDPARFPASVEEEVEYTRPEYYKRQTRHFEITQLRLPVYFADVNAIKSVDIDFTATLTNRSSRMFLEKHEFHLRDHLILQLEPSVATFPLEEEGKEIIRKKLFSEINDFLRHNKVEGQVTELKITYVLAN